MVSGATKAKILGVGVIAILIVLVLIGLQLGKGEDTKVDPRLSSLKPSPNPPPTPPLNPPLNPSGHVEYHPNKVYSDRMFKDSAFLANLVDLYAQYPSTPLTYLSSKPDDPRIPSVEDATKLITDFIAEQTDLDKSVFDLEMYKDRLIAAFIFYLRANEKVEMFDPVKWCLPFVKKPISSYFVEIYRIILDAMEADRIPAPEFLTMFPNLDNLVVHKCNITNWNGICDFKWLNNLKIEGCDLPEDLPRPVNVFGLTQLGLINCTGIKRISFEGCPKESPRYLRCLYLEGTKSIESIKGLFNFVPELNNIVFDEDYKNDDKVKEWLTGYGDDDSKLVIEYKKGPPPREGAY